MPHENDDESWLDSRPEPVEAGGEGGMLPVNPNHRTNVRDDEHRDFAALLAEGKVRSKHGGIIDIDKAHNDWSALDRDRLYQGYCTLVLSGASPESVRTWLKERTLELGMSDRRARDIINEGNGQWPGQNMQWWRGVSLT
jgi:hypothetical protein